MLSDKNLLLEPYVHGIYDPAVLPSGAHCCALTESMDQRKQIAKEFILKGLRSNQKVLYSRNDSTKDQIMSLLQEDLTHPESYLKSGQLQIVSFDEIFFENGQFNLAKRDSLMHELIESTKREGYSAIRGIGEMGWAAKNPIYLENLIKWEVIINQKFGDNPAFIGHCQYNVQDFPPSFLNHVLEIHPVCQIGKDLYPNQYYIPPEDFLSPLREERIFEKRIIQIKKRKRDEEQLSVLYKYTQDLREFSHMIAHDLNEPVRTAHIFHDILEREYEKKFPLKVQKILKLIKQSLNEGLSRIESLKDLNNLSRDSYVENIDVNTVIASVIDFYTESLNEISANIIFVKSDTPLLMRGSIKHIKQMLNNIINNSIKYRKKDTPLKIEISSKETSSKGIEVSVRDNGIGFNPAFNERIFLPFKRLHLQDEYEGSGIGLTICQKIMARYYGEIIAEGEEGEGALFTLRFPEQKHMHGQKK